MSAGFVLLLTAFAFQSEPVVEIGRIDSLGTSSFRGIAVRDHDSAWVGGSNGTLMRTNDAGKTWQQIDVPDSKGLDFRDIALFGENTAVVMAAGPAEASRIYRSTDDGKTWKRTFQNTAETGFFNAFAFWSAEDGVLVGDPQGGRLDLYRTGDGGVTWKPFADLQRPKLHDGEVGFAASGTNLVIQGNSNLFVATGGSHARVIASRDKGQTWSTHATPMTSGKPSTGIFSIAFRDDQHGVIVGGDYKDPESDNGNVAWTNDGGKSWNIVKQSGGIGHKACVRHLHGTTWLTVGRTGIAQSTDDGRTWKNISRESFFTFAVSPDKKSGWMAGGMGHVASFKVR